MRVIEFYYAVEADERLSGLGYNRVGFKIKSVPGPVVTQVPYTTIEDHEWADIAPVLYGDREPEVLRGMSRVVGYFSAVDNWNKSKKGELKDRQKGNYGMPTE